MPPARTTAPLPLEPFKDGIAPDAARWSDITKPVNADLFRHSFATHLIEAGYGIRTVQELMGHKDVRTTMVYVYVLNRGGRGVRRPADFKIPSSN